MHEHNMIETSLAPIMASTPSQQDQRKRTLEEALQRRFAVAKAELFSHQSKNKNTSMAPPSNFSSKKGNFYFGPSSSQDFEEDGQVYSKLSESIHKNLLPVNSKFSDKKRSMADKILHELLQCGDSAQKYMQGSRSIKFDNWILLDNFIKGRVMSTGSHIRALKNHSKRSKRHMSMKQLKESGVLKLPQGIQKFDTFKPIHEMWKGYMNQLLKTTGKNQLAPCLMGADLHGALILVTECKVTSLTGLSGIMIRETAETFGLITHDNKFRGNSATILKASYPKNYLSSYFKLIAGKLHYKGFEAEDIYDTIMQTSKARKSSVAASRRKPPPSMPRTARQSKMPGSDPGSLSSPDHTSKTGKDKFHKKDQPSRVTELEAELVQVRGDLKKTKDQLIASESWKRLALQEAEEAKQQLSTMSDKLEESEQKLREISASDDDRVQELRKISQERDKAWQSELEAVEKQHSMDSAALASAINEIQRLKVQLEKAYESSSIQSEHVESADAEIQNLRIELTETLTLVEKLKSELANRAESETELNFAKLEVGQLRSALDAAQVRYQEEYIRSTLQIRSAYEQVECIKTESCMKEAELEVELKRTKADIEELRSNHKRESELAAELKKLESELLESKANLTSKETELKTITEQNEMLEREIKKREIEADKSSRRAARVAEELGSAQAAKTEIEAELKRVKVQADQWRKAAEAATAMLSNNGKHSDKNMCFDMNYNQTIGSHRWENMDENDDDDDLSKKNGNMLRKIGVLWKKGQK